jgi:hypothetical protein
MEIYERFHPNPGWACKDCPFGSPVLDVGVAVGWVLGAPQVGTVGASQSFHRARPAIWLLPEFRWASLAALCAETLGHALSPVPA